MLKTIYKNACPCCISYTNCVASVISIVLHQLHYLQSYTKYILAQNTYIGFFNMAFDLPSKGLRKSRDLRDLWRWVLTKSYIERNWCNTVFGMVLSPIITDKIKLAWACDYFSSQHIRIRNK